MASAKAALAPAHPPKRPTHKTKTKTKDLFIPVALTSRVNLGFRLRVPHTPMPGPGLAKRQRGAEVLSRRSRFLPHAGSPSATNPAAMEREARKKPGSTDMH